ncbi:MAG: replication-associated recombination protein A [Bacteroidia bacterium]|nr:replication-associated recombination protein A [Bacteroidia bacterium]
MHIPPLAERMRPQKTEDIFGQEHLLRENSAFLQMLNRKQIPSMIFWGPPGVGKTTLAQVIANTVERPFRAISAIQSGVKEIREVIAFAEINPGCILFIDEIHRFNKAQQDALLGAVEKGIITLIGATTENPSFEVISALLSRCQVYILEALTEENIRGILEKAIKEDTFLKEKKIQLQETEAIYTLSGGDARKSLTLLEIFLLTQPGDKKDIIVTDEGVQKAAQTHIALYDKSGEQHYDIISAFIKSVRGGDPDAAVYWLARMLDGGEDVKFIARRMIILASEDIGNANPNALLLANACFQSVHVIGMPEARIILSQTATYLATSEKSNASYAAINDAMDYVSKSPPLPVPLHLRNAPTKLMKKLDYGKTYKYSHDYADNEGNQEYLPEAIRGKRFYNPKEIGNEKKIRMFMIEKWGRK